MARPGTQRGNLTRQGAGLRSAGRLRERSGILLTRSLRRARGTYGPFSRRSHGVRQREEAAVASEGSLHVTAMPKPAMTPLPVTGPRCK